MNSIIRKIKLRKLKKERPPLYTVKHFETLAYWKQELYTHLWDRYNKKLKELGEKEERIFK